MRDLLNDNYQYKTKSLYYEVRRLQIALISREPVESVNLPHNDIGVSGPSNYDVLVVTDSQGPDLVFVSIHSLHAFVSLDGP